MAKEEIGFNVTVGGVEKSISSFKDLKEAIKSFDEKIIILDKGNKWFIPSFLEFQYPSGLNPDNRAHNSVIILLE